MQVLGVPVGELGHADRDRLHRLGGRHVVQRHLPGAALEALPHQGQPVEGEGRVHHEVGGGVRPQPLAAERVPLAPGELPMRASEDFGRFGKVARSAMLFLGAGETHASLHNPDYDYPDELIGIGARVFMRTLRQLLG